MSDTVGRNLRALDAAVEDLLFIPNPEQRRVKAVLYTAIADNPMYDRASLTCEDVILLTGDRRVSRWWREAGFAEWCRNIDEFRQRLEYQAHLALDTLERVLSSDDPKMASAQVNAAKLIIEAASKMPMRHTKEIYADDRIAKMSQQQLEEYIKKNTAALSSSTPPAPAKEEK